MLLRYQAKRKRIPFFAPWATIKGDNDKILHSIEDGAIVRKVESGTKYFNHIETAGLKSAAIISYGNDSDGTLKILRHAVYPTLRLFPNDTHSSLDNNFKGVTVSINGKPCTEKAKEYIFDGVIKIVSDCDGVKIERTLFAGGKSKVLIELIDVTAKKDKTVVEFHREDKDVVTDKKYGNKQKQYRLFCAIDTKKATVNADETVRCAACYGACNKDDYMNVYAEEEYEARKKFIADIDDTLILETPDEVINSMFRYSKIRAAESICKTKNGLMHSPGGGGYYAALWTNDQCEYVNPLFGYMGYKTGKEEAINCYNLYKKYISPDTALVTSIVACGDDVWHGAKDRGDSAMYAYGCSRFLLSSGDKKLAKDYIKYIDYCLTYTLSKKTSDGVIASDSDELENRFESGKANLSTSCLAYDALLSASYIHAETGDIDKSDYYKSEADALRNSIESYFGATVEGFETYRYCKEEKNLRSWICLPLAVGITERTKGTTDALLSDKLCHGYGLLTRSGGKTFWERSTLYALRGLFYSGETEKAGELLEGYTKYRHLGNHPPYAVEAFPEGNQAQLSAESGLYIRIFTEGILGYRPLGFNSFELSPHLPEKLNDIKLKKFHTGKKVIDIAVKSVGDKYDITVSGDISAEYKSVEKVIVSF